MLLHWTSCYINGCIERNGSILSDVCRKWPRFKVLSIMATATASATDSTKCELGEIEIIYQLIINGSKEGGSALPPFATI